MTAPERIFIHPTERCPVSKVWKRGKWKDHDSGASGDVGYIRADLHDAENARLTAERDAALAGRVRVKPLVWEDDGHGNLRAQSIRGGEGIDAMRYADGELAHFEAWGIDADFHDQNSAMAAVQHEIEAEVSAVLAALEPQPITVQDAARVPEIKDLIDAAVSLHKNAMATKARIAGGISGQTIEAMLRSTFHQSSLYDLYILQDALRAIAEQEAK